MFKNNYIAEVFIIIFFFLFYEPFPEQETNDGFIISSNNNTFYCFCIQINPNYKSDCTNHEKQKHSSFFSLPLKGINYHHTIVTLEILRI